MPAVDVFLDMMVMMMMMRMTYYISHVLILLRRCETRVGLVDIYNKMQRMVRRANRDLNPRSSAWEAIGQTDRPPDLSNYIQNLPRTLW